jgi:hypothetical protein
MSQVKSFSTPGINDVKPGGGAHKNQHGNKHYHDLVSAKKVAYVQARDDVKRKDAIAQSIYDSMLRLDPPGRFLTKNADGSYSIKDKKSALTKIKTALIQNSPKIIDYLKQRGKWKDSGRKVSQAKSITKPNIPKLTTSPKNSNKKPRPTASPANLTSKDWEMCIDALR